MRVAIAGAGIAGLTTALSLSRAGIATTVFERNDVLSEVGAGLQLSPNAGRVLERLGLGAALDRFDEKPHQIEMRSAKTGRKIVALPLADAAKNYGAPYRLIHRADLQSLLLEAVEAESRIELRLGETLGSLRKDAGRLHFEAGKRPESADLLIGADGVRSVVRAFMGAAPAQMAGRTAWRTTLSGRAMPVDLPRDQTTVFLGERSHVVIYPIRSGNEINVIAVVEEAWQGEGWSEPGDPNWLESYFSDQSEVLLRWLGAAPSWTRWCLAAIDPAGAWTAPNVALIGDAAHAMLPFLAQGAAMAIEDAAVIAEELSRPGIPLDAALRAYESRRRPRVSRVWKAAAESGTIYHMAGLPAVARDLAMKTLGGKRLLARYDWIYRWRPDATSER